MASKMTAHRLPQDFREAVVQYLRNVPKGEPVSVQQIADAVRQENLPATFAEGDLEDIIAEEAVSFGHPVEFGER